MQVVLVLLNELFLKLAIDICAFGLANVSRKAVKIYDDPIIRVTGTFLSVPDVANTQFVLNNTSGSIWFVKCHA